MLPRHNLPHRLCLRLRAVLSATDVTLVGCRASIYGYEQIARVEAMLLSGWVMLSLPLWKQRRFKHVHMPQYHLVTARGAATAASIDHYRAAHLNEFEHGDVTNLDYRPLYRRLYRHTLQRNMHNFVVAHTTSQQTPRATHLLTCGMSQAAVCSNSEAAGHPAQQNLPP